MNNFNQKNVLINAEEISELIQKTIEKWHTNATARNENYVIVTDDIRRIRPFNEHRDDLNEVITELTNTNTEMWHEEDKVRSQNDEVVLKAIRNINPLNQHRNDLMEEIDEIIIEKNSKEKS